MRSILSEKRVLFDGAMGTMLQTAGLPAGMSPDQWNMSNADAVLSVHTAYLEAGAQVVISNTFGSNAFRLKKCAFDAGETARQGVAIARRAADRYQDRYVALDVGPLGEFIEPMGDLTIEEATEAFRPCVEAGADAGADCILIETMCDLTEALAAVDAAKKYGNGLPVFCTLSYDANGRLMTGLPLERVIEALEDAGVDGLGANCGVGPEQLAGLLPRFLAAAHVPLLMSPNAGLPRFFGGKTVYDVTPALFSERMKPLADGGVWGLGGCCGTTPAHISALATLLGRSNAQ